jgi:Mrp family chromosome partitioning ATPase
MNGISEAAAILGKVGGKKGGRSKSTAKIAAARANLKKAQGALDADARRERARKAAWARWNKSPG